MLLRYGHGVCMAVRVACITSIVLILHGAHEVRYFAALVHVNTFSWNRPDRGKVCLDEVHLLGNNFHLHSPIL